MNARQKYCWGLEVDGYGVERQKVSGIVHEMGGNASNLRLSHLGYRSARGGQ